MKKNLNKIYTPEGTKKIWQNGKNSIFFSIPNPMISKQDFIGWGKENGYCDKRKNL